MKGIAILGSTGSIGVSALDVIGNFPDRFNVVALAAGQRVERLADQIRTFRPRLVSVAGDTERTALLALLSPDDRDGVEIICGLSGPEAVVSHGEVDIVITAMVGGMGLPPTLAAIRRGLAIAIANKEPLVMAGKLCTEEAAAHGALLLPVDSEHSAIFQCLRGNVHGDVHKIHLTCSGGPFRQSPTDLSAVTVEQALKHPTWSMGPKITIDSSTLMNKGLEVIEAHWLFDLPADKIDILIHPQSVIHSMVEYSDGAVLAQLGTPDMRVPIAYAIGFPSRLPLSSQRIRWTELGQLTFEAPDYQRFRAPQLAYNALSQGGTAPAVLNAANEVAVAAFLERRIGYTDIVRIVEETLETHQCGSDTNLDDILSADRWARAQADAFVETEH